MLFYSLNFMVSIFFLIPMLITLISTPFFIRKFKEKKVLVKDMYKKNHPSVATRGGLIILLVSLLSLSILSLFYSRYIDEVNYAVIMVVTIFALFGILDDTIDIGRPAKLILLYYCSYALLPFLPENLFCCVPFFGTLVFGSLALQIIIPLYVPVVANLVNMHSGFNGLAPGLSLLILLTLIAKTIQYGDICRILFIISLTGAVAGYFIYESYPARIFWGNIGALSVGSAIGAVIVTEGFLISGFVILIPHTLNFLMYVYWRLNSEKYPVVKFGKEKEDGSLSVPNPLTLKWVIPYYFPVTEKQALLLMYLLTGVFCLIGFMVPG